LKKEKTADHFEEIWKQRQKSQRSASKVSALYYKKGMMARRTPDNQQ
jgi:hypothetical protein